MPTPAELLQEVKENAKPGIWATVPHTTDPNNDTLTFIASQPVNGGTVQITGPDGRFTYTPSAQAKTAGTDDRDVQLAVEVLSPEERGRLRQGYARGKGTADKLPARDLAHASPDRRFLHE